MSCSCIFNPHYGEALRFPVDLSVDAAERARAFHRGIDGYAPTPLHSLDALAASVGVAKIYVKDESKRFGLNAFKALGGSYAIARCLCEELGIPLDENSFARLRSEEYANKVRGRTFVTATDGNHGRGVAWAAKMLGSRAVVYLPQGTVEERLGNILALGAAAEITAMNYDDTVRHAKEMAAEKGWTLVQDTAWPGYERIPGFIMQGYLTMVAEIKEQLGGDIPTHLFLQAGVGSMAAAVAGGCRALWGEECPRIVIVEPDKADCLYRTALADDGTLHTVSGAMDSMMAGLCCGEPCTIAWEVLRPLATAFVSMDDSYAALGMRALGLPKGGDPAIVSGESGAASTGAALGLLTAPELAGYRERLGPDARARVLLISTEGDTDRENYRRVLAE